METGRDGTISGFNEYVKGLKADKETDYSISLIQFNIMNVGPELMVSYADTPLSDVPDLSRDGYQPAGGTPLYDAIGECVRRIDAKGRDVLVVIITDGEENSSREFSREKILALIKEKEALGWKFVFLGAEIDSYQVGGAMGMTTTATANYNKGNEYTLYAELERSTKLRSATLRSSGLQAANCMAFFDDSQKLAMVDNSSNQGGGAAGLGGFPAPVSVGPTPTVTTANATPRKWTVSNASGSGEGA